MNKLLVLYLIFSGIISVLGKLKIVCFYTSWTTYRVEDQYKVEDIKTGYCTHLVYAFLTIHNNSLTYQDPWLDASVSEGGQGNIDKFRNSQSGTNTKLMFAVGGWGAGSEEFSNVSKTQESRAKFIQSSIKLIKKHKVHGLDIHWQYPGLRLGNLSDKENLILLLKEAKPEFEKSNLILAISVGATEAIAKISYNIPEIHKHVDFINLLTYDYHGPWESTIQSHSSIVDVQDSLNLWINAGTNKSKILISIPTFGRTYTLEYSDSHLIGDRAVGPGDRGESTLEPGFISYYEVCKRLRSGWNRHFSNSDSVPYVYKDYQWISYEDLISVSIKTRLVLKLGLGGVSIWSLDNDDFNKVCENYVSLAETISYIFP